MKILKYNSFILDSENYVDMPSNFLYGFKVFENYGFYFELNNKQNIIRSSSSLLMPCIVYFQKDNYWAI